MIYKFESKWPPIGYKQIYIVVKPNGSQLAKMKTSIPDMSLPWNSQEWSSWSKKLQIYLGNYDFCENVKFEAIILKIWYFVNNCLIEVRFLKILLHTCDTYNCDYLQHSTFRFNLIDFQLNTDFPFQFCIFDRKIT